MPKIFRISWLLLVSTVLLIVYFSRIFTWNCSETDLWCFSSSSARISMSTGRHKHTSVAFLKTHKTGSSTVLNILFRFAEHHSLTVAMPTAECGGYQFCYPRLFSVHFVQPHPVPPDILACHSRLDVPEMRRVMPADTRYITILREPAAMFESIFIYYRTSCSTFQRVPQYSLEMFLRDPQLYYRAEEGDSMYARNMVTFDLGGEKDRPLGDSDYAASFTAHVEDVFSLVMIAEHFDESLVLLRRLLDWELEDVLYLKQNMRTERSSFPLQRELSAKIRAWNWLDAALYDHFNASLWRQLERLGLADVEREVRLMRKMRDRMVRDCFGADTPLSKPASQIGDKALRPWQPSNEVAIVGYELPVDGPGRTCGGSGVAEGGGGEDGVRCGMNKDTCMKIVMPELPMTDHVRQSQLLRYQHKRD